MILRLVSAVLLVASLSACADTMHYGAIAVEKRRTMNDIQARATMAAACDISVGAFFRELNEIERRYTALMCGGEADDAAPVGLSRQLSPAGDATAQPSVAPLAREGVAASRMPKPASDPRPVSGPKVLFPGRPDCCMRAI